MEFLILIFLKLFKIFLCKRDFYFCVAERVETRPQLLFVSSGISKSVKKCICGFDFA